MLSENLQELLSAYVDGELSSAEYERVMSALRDSEAARAYVQQLRDLSSRLKSLPAMASPINFSQRYFESQRQTSRRRTRGWLAAGAIAASLIVAVASWWMLRPQPPGIHSPSPNNANLAHLPPTPRATKPAGTPVPTRAVDAEAVRGFLAWSKSAAGEFQRNWEHVSKRSGQSLAWLAEAEALRETRALDHAATLLSAPIKMANNPFKTLDIELPLLQSPAEFSVASLRDRWEKNGLFVLDMNSNDSVLTLERLLDVAKQRKTVLAMDEEVRQRIAKRLPATFLIYLENTDDKQLEELLQGLMEKDFWKNSLNAAHQSTQSLLFYALDGEGKKLLARGLGVNAERLQPAGFKNASAKNSAAVVVSYYPTRVAETISPGVREALSNSSGPRSDRLSIVLMIRQGK